MTTDWIDISVPLKSGMIHWPGDGEVSILKTSRMDAGDEVNLTQINMSAHTGTHIDAPLHFLPDGTAIDRMPVEVMLGRARVLTFPQIPVVTAADLAVHDIRPGDRILIKTDNSDGLWHNQPFEPDFVHLATDAAIWLAERKPALIGIDYLSVAGFEHNESEVHEALLGAGIWILEGLNLSKLIPGQYELICLPLKLAGADGAPARALVRRLDHE